MVQVGLELHRPRTGGSHVSPSGTRRTKYRNLGLVAEVLVKELRHFGHLGARVVDQAQRRVLQGEQVPNDEKIFSIFEPSDGGHRAASDKTQGYERLRARLLETHHTPLAAASAVVLVRQGMSAWMQLEDDPPRPDHDLARDHTAALPTAEHSELLTVLTGLVFHLCSQKESA